MRPRSRSLLRAPGGGAVDGASREDANRSVRPLDPERLGRRDGDYVDTLPVRAPSSPVKAVTAC